MVENPLVDNYVQAFVKQEEFFMKNSQFAEPLVEWKPLFAANLGLSSKRQFLKTVNPAKPLMERKPPFTTNHEFLRDKQFQRKAKILVHRTESPIRSKSWIYHRKNNFRVEGRNLSKSSRRNKESRGTGCETEIFFCEKSESREKRVFRRNCVSCNTEALFLRKLL